MRFGLFSHGTSSDSLRVSFVQVMSVIGARQFYDLLCRVRTNPRYPVGVNRLNDNAIPDLHRDFPREY